MVNLLRPGEPEIEFSRDEILSDFQERRVLDIPTGIMVTPGLISHGQAYAVDL